MNSIPHTLDEELCELIIINMSRLPKLMGLNYINFCDKMIQLILDHSMRNKTVIILLEII